MALITWKDQYSVNIKAIDAQHKKLVELINQIHDATKAARGKDVLEKILFELVTYTKVHFSAEEQLMKKYAYPGYNTQKAEHEALVKRVQDFQAEFKAGRSTMSVEVMQFLMDWLTGHIQGLDKKYSSFLNEKGVN
jgi:hemerythrin